MGRKEKNFRWEELSPDDRMKYEIAEELGLLEKVTYANGASQSDKRRLEIPFCKGDRADRRADDEKKTGDEKR